MASRPVVRGTLTLRLLLTNVGSLYCAQSRDMFAVQGQVCISNASLIVRGCSAKRITVFGLYINLMCGIGGRRRPDFSELSDMSYVVIQVAPGRLFVPLSRSDASAADDWTMRLTRTRRTMLDAHAPWLIRRVMSPPLRQ